MDAGRDQVREAGQCAGEGDVAGLQVDASGGEEGAGPGLADEVQEEAREHRVAAAGIRTAEGGVEAADDEGVGKLPTGLLPSPGKSS